MYNEVKHQGYSQYRNLCAANLLFAIELCDLFPLSNNVGNSRNVLSIRNYTKGRVISTWWPMNVCGSSIILIACDSHWTPKHVEILSTLSIFPVNSQWISQIKENFIMHISFLHKIVEIKDCLVKCISARLMKCLLRNTTKHETVGLFCVWLSLLFALQIMQTVGLFAFNCAIFLRFRASSLRFYVLILHTL